MKNIDYALVEEKRPPMYTAMKYWGKKPHNIWGTYIDTYAEKNGVILDPFAGSAIAAFEAVKQGRKAIAFDINPLTSFIIDVYSTKFDIEKFKKSVEEIVNKISNDETYAFCFQTICKECGNERAIVQHAKWENGRIYEYGVVCHKCKKRYLAKDIDNQNFISEKMLDKEIPFWYPTDLFYHSPSFTETFKKNIGGNDFSYIWTKRNLYVLSYIFHEIIEIKNIDIKKQLLFGFIQSLHLASKMCVPRRENSNRSFSTSWGRSAYICSKRQMEMNPLLLFESSCLGKQSVKSALSNIEQHIGKTPTSVFVKTKNDFINATDYDIIYGIIDINKISDYISEESISFIITDPPYGGLVQYVDLSQIWLVWLKKYDKKYIPDIDSEITIKKGIKDITEYTDKFTNGIKNLYTVLKPDGKIVFTFHNKDLMVWNAFLRSISKAGFRVEKVIHQQNRRTGESNVANPYGTSASDFYIRCSKSEYVEKIKTSKDVFENFIVDRAVNIIKARNEATPYQILFNGLLSEISKAGFDLENFDENIHYFLEKHIGDIFTIEKNNESYGNLWWIKNYNADEHSVIPLSERVEKTVLSLLKEKQSLKLDEVLAEIFSKYPNGLTPDIKKIDEYIKKYAYKSGEKWVYKENGAIKQYGRKI